MAPEMPDLAGQQQMGSQEVHAVTSQTPGSKGAALARAHACLVCQWGRAAKAGRSCSTERNVTGECNCGEQLSGAAAGVQTTVVLNTACEQTQMQQLNDSIA